LAAARGSAQRAPQAPSAAGEIFASKGVWVAVLLGKSGLQQGSNLFRKGSFSRPRRSSLLLDRRAFATLLLHCTAALLLFLLHWQLLRACQQGYCCASCTRDAPGESHEHCRRVRACSPPFALLFCMSAQLAAA